MIKGLLAIFKSRAIMNPMTLIGIIFGISAMNHFKEFDLLYGFYKSVFPYVLFLVISIIYNLLFKKVYTGKNRHFDLQRMVFNILISFIQGILVSYLTISFVIMMAM
jgi:hypothetical protein